MHYLRFLTLALVFSVCATDLQHAGAADPKGKALTIGLNKVSPAHYGGWEGELFACESDARDMASIAKSRGFEVDTLLTAQAKRAAVLDSMKAAADVLASGDIFMLSYSGHGGQVFDENGDEKSNGPDDVVDETWCLFDGQMIDDELYLAFRKFKPGVRILLFSDSCHSGTVAKAKFYDQIVQTYEKGSLNGGLKLMKGSTFDLGEFFLNFNREPTWGPGIRPFPSGPPPFRAMPLDVARRTWVMHREEYKKIGTNSSLGTGKHLEARGDEGEIPAHGLLISGCQDNQLSKDGWLNGAFTGALKQVLTDAVSAEVKNYRTFHAGIVKRFQNDPSQTPNYYPFGKFSPEFEAQAPFMIK